MSISWEGFGGISAWTPASEASDEKGLAAFRQGTRKVLAVFRQGGQHHGHQLGRVWQYFGREASIMSISWDRYGGISARRPES